MTKDEKIIELANTNKEAKTKAKELFPELFIKYNENKIYAYKGMNDIYKLHRINSQYAFISNNNSISYANGLYNTPEECLKSVSSFREFKNAISFLNWCIENI